MVCMMNIFIFCILRWPQHIITFFQYMYIYHSVLGIVECKFSINWGQDCHQQYQDYIPDVTIQCHQIIFCTVYSNIHH
ncbi:unnamed protein product [Choristocarpus tenellus]